MPQLHRPWMVVAAALALLLYTAGCRSYPVIEPELSDETVTSVPQRGTPALWDAQWEASAADGRPRVGLLDHGDEALALRINLIRSATETIRLQTFIWYRSETSRLITWELMRAVRQRGVRVQILADHMLSAKDVNRIVTLCRFDPRIEVRVFGPIGKRLHPGSLGLLGSALGDFSDLNMRMHNKLMVVDDRIAITGGRNIANEYFDRSAALNFKDRDVVVVGPDVAPAVEAFDAYWSSSRVMPVEELEDVATGLQEPVDPDARAITRGDLELNNLFPTMSSRCDDEQYVRETFVDTLYDVDGIEWIADDPLKFDEGDPDAPSWTVERLTTLLRDSDHEVLIQSPYLVLAQPGIRLLRELREEHPDLSLIVSTNSLAATDAWTSYAASYQQKRIYLQDLGMQIWEFRPIPQDIDTMMAYQPLLDRKLTPDEAASLPSAQFNVDPRLEPYPVVVDGAPAFSNRRLNDHTGQPPHLCLHAKSMVFDGRYAFIGSYNLSPRSASLNTEIGLLVDDVRFAAALRRSIETDMAPRNSYLVADRTYFMPLDEISESFHKVSESLPIDLWPLRHAGSFVLRDGMEPVPRGHPDFDDHWEDVGSFPLVKGTSSKQISVRLFKMLGPLLYPFL